MNENEAVEIKKAIATLSEAVAYVLRHLSDPEDIRESDKYQMERLAEEIDQLAASFH